MVLSLILALAFGDAPAALPAESARTACDDRMPPPIDPRHRVDDLAAFDRAHAGMSVAGLVALLGPAQADIGSGLHVLVWDARDGRRLRVSAGDVCRPVIAFRRFDR